MNRKQVFQAGVGVAGLAVLVFTGVQVKEVAYGASEFTGAGGPLTGAGLFAGASGLLYSLLTIGKSLLTRFMGTSNDKAVSGGLAILQSLVSGKTDAFGVTKHGAVAILFADAIGTGDQEYLETVILVSRKALKIADDPAKPQPEKKEVVTP